MAKRNVIPKFTERPVTQPKILPSANAVRVLAWRCPDCQRMNFSERSHTHTGTCVSCGHKVGVNVNPAKVADPVPELVLNTKGA